MKRIMYVLMCTILLTLFVSCKEKEVPFDGEIIFDSFGSSEEEVDSALSKYDIDSYEYHPDSTVTIKLSEEARDAMIEELDEQIPQVIEGLINNKKLIDATKVTYNDDCSEFNIYVNKSSFNERNKVVNITYFFIGKTYQSYLDYDFESIDVVVNFIDDKNDELIEKTTLKQLENFFIQ